MWNYYSWNKIQNRNLEQQLLLELEPVQMKTNHRRRTLLLLTLWWWCHPKRTLLVPVGVVVVAAHWRMVDVDLGAVYYRQKMTWLLHHRLYWKSCSILR